jgi:hypothetical protein
VLSGSAIGSVLSPNFDPEQVYAVLRRSSRAPKRLTATPPWLEHPTGISGEHEDSSRTGSIKPGYHAEQAYEL